jgi:DDE superfamily endonuclease
MKRYPNLLDYQEACRYLWPSPNHSPGRRSRWHAAGSLHGALSYPSKSGRPWNAGNGRPPWPPGTPSPRGLRRLACHGPWSGSGPSGVSRSAWIVSRTPPAAGPRAVFPPAVALPVVRLAGERPDPLGRRLSPWDGAALAHPLLTAGIVEGISAATVRRILAGHHLQPWRHHRWRYPTKPRDAACYATISERIDRDTRPRQDDERVLSGDEKTSWQPRCRLPPTQPAPPGNLPHRHAHEDKRRGALTVLAAFDTRSGPVFGQGYGRTRQQEFITFLDQLAAALDHHIKTIHLVGDHVSTHHGQEVRNWLGKHPRVVWHVTPVHGSWMNQVEQWCSIFQRKRWRIADFDAKEPLQAKIGPFILAWNQRAHPFNWSTKSVVKVMAAGPAMAA